MILLIEYDIGTDMHQIGVLLGSDDLSGRSARPLQAPIGPHWPIHQLILLIPRLIHFGYSFGSVTVFQLN